MKPQNPGLQKPGLAEFGTWEQIVQVQNYNSCVQS